MSSTNQDTIDIGKLWRKICTRKKLFYMVWCITFVVASALILCVPRYYSTSVKLAPELGGSDIGSSTISSIASSFGFDLGGMQTTDAINPLLYPDLMEDNAFVTRLFSLRVKNEDGSIDTDYYTYLRKHQKSPWWSKAMSWVKKLFKSNNSNGGASGESVFDPYHLSKDDDGVANAIRGNIMFSINDKTGVITISAKAQDPIICKTLADTMQMYLQEYITEYRTKKARVDLEHYEKLCAAALDEYNEARLAYSAYAEANRNAVQERVVTQIANLESEMQLKYTNYTAYSTQLQAALSKVQERTPAFTTLKGADVPVMPAGPKRMAFVILMLILATAVTMAVVLRKDVWSIIVIRK